MKYAILVLTCMATLAAPAAFADSSGQSELSERRAQAVADALGSDGGSRLVNASSQAGSGTQSDRQQNRRVGFLLTRRQAGQIVRK
ncbi:MAG: hypothetical protein AAFN63_18215 [Pseudomonadota bacterium]